jgi:hypothetical protein
MEIIPRPLPPRLGRLFRTMVRFVFAWFVVGGGIAVVASAFAGDIWDVAFFLVPCVVGFIGWRATRRPYVEWPAAGQVLARLEAKINAPDRPLTSQGSSPQSGRGEHEGK